MASAPVTAGTTDPLFDAPYVDIDEWQEEPVGHRYVHGGFEGTDARFAIRFPPAERYEGRFFHPIFAVPGSEHMFALPGSVLLSGLGGSVGFAVASGAYLVESNQGSLNGFSNQDWTVTGYRTSAAVARYSRVLAAEMYGDHRPYGYVFGGSGGAYKTMSCFENVPGLWDGAVPFMHGTPMSVPNNFTVQNHAIRVLHDRFPMIVDAVEPGGSGDMFSGLNAEECEALAEVTRMGFLPRAWFDAEDIANHFHGVWAFLIDNVTKWDPEYFEDFWTVPGYLGASPPQSLARARIQHKATVAKPLTADEARTLGVPVLTLQSIGADPDVPVALRIEGLPEKRLQGASVTVSSGVASGRLLHVVDVFGDVVLTGFGPDHPEGLRGVVAGDEVLIDNSDYLASQTYHRHQLHPGLPQFDQFRAGGQPMYPQRPKLMGPRAARYNCGSVQSGRFAGKMIVVQHLMDEAAYPSQAHFYRQMVEAALGSRVDDHYRLWFVDHAMHHAPEVEPGDARPVRTTRIVSYVGVIQQALRALADWVEKGLAPPPSTDYEYLDGQIVVPLAAQRRKGVQPVVAVTANGGPRADVGIDEVVEFHGVVEVPTSTGTIVAIEWDFEGAGDYPLSQPGFEQGGDQSRMTVTASHAFSQPGTYYPALRVTSQRQGDAETPYGRVQNLGRVRVVVH
jgi:hypothetical protein